MAKLYGGIEGGGTKFVCAIGTSPDDLRAETRFRTSTPAETVQKTVDFFVQAQREHGKIAALGLASFGPIDLRPESPTCGYITSTPKPGWAYFGIRDALQQALGVTVGFETDVNGAALGEWRWGAGKGLDTLVYLTIGTGIGGGVITNHQVVHGLVHPEVGHYYLPHDRSIDPFEGICPYHKDCLEGLASGPAIEKRWGQRGEILPLNHPAWDLEATYLAYAMVNLVLTVSPQRIILGGGVMEQPHLFALVREKTKALLHGYINSEAILQQIDSYIVPPGLGPRSGVLGAIALAEQVAEYLH